MLTLRSAGTRHEETISLLRHQCEEANEGFGRDLRERDERASALLREVEEKSNAVATLTQQLHRSRVLLKRALDEGQGGATSPSSGRGATPHAAQSDALPRSSKASKRVQRTTSNPPDGRVRVHSCGVEDTRPLSSGPSPPPPPPSSSEGSAQSLSVSSLQRVTSPSEVPSRPPIVSPPLTPRPPSSSTSPSAGPVRRASNPLRRGATQPPYNCSGGPSDPLIMPTHAIVPREAFAGTSAHPTLQQQQQLKLGPVRSRKRSNPPPDVVAILQTQGGKEAPLGKPPPPVLPPILSDPSRPTPPPAATAQQSDPCCVPDKCDLAEGNDGTVPSHDRTIIVGTRVHLPPGHRHIILAKSQGGVGSTPSTLRVMQYGGGGAGVGEDPASKGVAEEEEETAEGTLMVKENVSRKEHAWQELHQHGGD